MAPVSGAFVMCISYSIVISSCCIFIQIFTLQDFFKDETVFVAYGSERCSVDDFELSSNGKL